MPDIVSHIIVTGICLFVRPNTTDPPKRAVFMEGRRDRRGQILEGCNQHHLYLAVENRKYEIDQDPPNKIDFEKVVGTGNRSFMVAVLDDYHLQVTSAVRETQVKDAIGDLPHLGRVWCHRISGDARAVNPDLYLDRRSKAMQNRINSILTMPNGEAKIRFNSLAEWGFSPRMFPRSEVVGTIPQEVSLDSTLQGDALEISVSDVDDRTLVTKIRIKRRDSFFGDISVLLANVPDKDLFPDDACMASVDCAKSPHHICCTDHHFALYYNAFDDPPNNPPIPLRRSRTMTSELSADPRTFLYREGGGDCGPANQP